MSAPASEAGARRRPLQLPLLGLMAGAQTADPTIASTALVESARSLGMDSGLQAIAASISTLMLAATVISTGLLADRIGRRRLLVLALALAAVGDLVVALAPDPALYLAGRALAGIGLGAVFGASFAYLRLVVPPSAIASAMGAFAAYCAVAMILASFVGGSLASIDWRLSFLVIPAICAACLVATPLLLPREPPQTGGRQDVAGQVLLAVGVAALLYGVSHAGSGLAEPLTWAPLLIGVVALALFAVVELRSDHAFFPVRLFGDPGFIAAVGIGLAFNFAQAVAVLQFANIWQFVEGFSTVQVSLGQLPLTITSIVVAVLVGRLITRGLSAGTAAVLGGVATAAGFASLALVLVSASFLAFLPALLLIGAGISAMSVPYGSLIIKIAPVAQFGAVTSSRTTIGQVGYALGLAGGMVVVDGLTRGGVIRRLAEAGVPPTRTGEALDAIQAYTSTGALPSSETGTQALQDAAASYHVAFVVAMLVTAAIVLALTALVGLSYRRWARAAAAG